MSEKDEQQPTEEVLPNEDPNDNPASEENTDTPNEEIVDSLEDEARGMGWKPKDDFDGKSGWVSAETFVARKPLFGKISDQNQQIRKLGEQVQNLGGYIETARKGAYKQAMRDLKTERTAARKDDDHDAVERIEEDLEQLKEDFDNTPTMDQAPVQQNSAAYDKWLSQNDWYENDSELKEDAEMWGNRLQGKGYSEEVWLEKISEKIRSTNPKKFTNPKRAKASAVAGGDTRGGSTKPKMSDIEAGMTREAKSIMNSIIAPGSGITKKQYLQDLADQEG